MSTSEILPSRRALLRGTGAVGALGAVGASGVALTGAAHAASYTAVRHGRSHPLRSAEHHLVKRFSYGVTPGLAADVRQVGGARKWFAKQLQPTRFTDGPGDELDGWWPSIRRSPAEIWQRQVQEIEAGWQVMEDYQRWLLVRRMRTRRQVLELMSEFWQNHLNVSANGDSSFTYRCDYDLRMRAVSLGSFEEILHTAVTHPAMGIFLDNATSTKAHPNENLGRELLELHTVGRGNFTEDDVKSSARILTGYRVDVWRTWDATYNPAEHWTGPVTVMGFSHANAAGDGRPVVSEYLSYLARHPLTAQRIARKLAVKFVSDQPSQELVDELAAVYLENDTQIRPVLLALIDAPEFATSPGSKVRDPGEDVVATYRALRVRLKAPPAGESQFAAEAVLWQSRTIGTAPFAWPRPDGQPIDNESWASPARMISSMELHWSMSGGWWPTQGITYRSDRSWLPKKRIRLAKLVDCLSVQLLGVRSTDQILQACCEATGLPPGEVIHREHPLVLWNFHRLLATLLDSPTHLTR